MSFCELGVLLLTAAIPMAFLLPHKTIILSAISAASFVAYIFRAVPMKHTLKPSAVDVSVAAFAVIRLLSGFFAFGGINAFAEAVLDFFLICAYFPMSIVAEKSGGLKRVSSIFFIFSAFAMLIGILQMFESGYESGWLDSVAFSEIRVRVTSTFGNPNVFASYILLVMPFAAVGVVKGKRLHGKLLPAFVLASAMLCLVQTWSRGAWLGVCVSTVAFAVLCSRRTLPYLFASGAAFTLLVPIAFPNVAKRFVSIGNFSESSVSYRISAWNGIFEMIKENFVFGIGYGEASFSAIYPRFAKSGAEAVKHTHSLYLQILTESGIFGLLAFFSVVFFFFKSCFGYLRRSKEKKKRLPVIAGLSAAFGFLVMSLADYVWYNSEMLLAFFLAMAFANSFVRIYSKSD